MKARKWTHGTVGSVSSGTMRTQDLLPSFTYELRYLGHRDKRLTVIEKRLDSALNGHFGKNDAYFENEESAWDLETLFDMLESHSLPYMYFGAHPGNGSDYGFWLSEVFINDDFDGLTVSDLNEIPVNHTGEVLHVNDHGNMTLYKCSRGKLREVWAVRSKLIASLPSL